MKSDGPFLIIFFGLLAAVALFNVVEPLEQSARTPAASELQSGDYTLADYAKECEEELGEIPEINCLEGETIPVTNSDVEPGLSTEITKENFHSKIKCDRPSLLRNSFTNYWGGFNPCVPFMRVGRVDNQDTSWVWTCRRYFLRDKENPYFDDINMIGHNKKTGGTCFFVNNINRKRPAKPGFWSWIKRKKPNEFGDIEYAENGTKIPAIRKDGMTSAEALEFWTSPKKMTHSNPIFGGSERCIACHDNGPFIHSPFIRQVHKDGKALVPSIMRGPYWMVGSKYFTEWETKYLVSEEAENCTSCHRIGNQRSCGEFARYSVGMKQLPHHTKAFMDKAWMPQSRNAAKVWAPNEIDEDDQKAVKFINHCCKKPNDPKCVWEEMMPKP